MRHIYFVGGTYFMTDEVIDPNLTIIQGYRWIKSRKTFSLTKKRYFAPHYELVSTNYQAFMKEHGKYH